MIGSVPMEKGELMMREFILRTYTDDEAETCNKCGLQEIVRCKDCAFGCAYNEKWYLPKRDGWWCVKEEKEVSEDFFCADGERRGAER